MIEPCLSSRATHPNKESLAIHYLTIDRPWVQLKGHCSYQFASFSAFLLLSAVSSTFLSAGRGRCNKIRGWEGRNPKEVDANTNPTKTAALDFTSLIWMPKLSCGSGHLSKSALTLRGSTADPGPISPHYQLLRKPAGFLHLLLGPDVATTNESSGLRKLKSLI